MQTWLPGPGSIMPFGHATRADNVACNAFPGPAAEGVNCQVVPNNLRLPSAGGTLNPATTTIEDYGNALVPWHNGTHVAMARGGGAINLNTVTCPLAEMTGPVLFKNILCVTTAPRDPMFFKFHNFVNDLQDEVLTFQDTDVMIVLDRSGSMGIADVGGGVTRLNAAKDAANLFADLLRDARATALASSPFRPPPRRCPSCPSPPPRARRPP